MKRAIVSVTNDLVTDRRVDKSCRALEKSGFEVTLVGRRKRQSLQLESRSYKTRRLFLLFEKGPLFYAEFNTRLFFFLLFKRADLYLSNDLDTLSANYLSSKIKRVSLIYDTHEYYTGTPELINRPFVQGIWKRIEKCIFPKLNDVITVNDSIALLYEKEYGIKLYIVRNIPPFTKINESLSRTDLGLPENKFLVILQGAGINIERGAEEAVQAMKHLDDVVLLIVGGGDVMPVLKEIVNKDDLHSKVIFMPKQPFSKLIHLTKCADLGITIDKDTNINYRFSLPNKLFDYIHSGVPVLASQLIEIKNIIELFDIGGFIDNHEPEHIALCIKSIKESPDTIKRWKMNLKKAAEELSWDNEEKVLLNIFKKYA